MFLAILALGFIVAVNALILSKYVKSLKDENRTLQDMYSAISYDINRNITDICERVACLEQDRGRNYHGKKNNPSGSSRNGMPADHDQ